MNRFSLLTLACLLAAPLPLRAEDHPLLGHMEGATEVGYRAADFDEARLIVGPIEERTSVAQEGDGWKTFEGKVFHIYHRLPDGVSSLQALRSYEAGLKERGFVTAFTCSTEAGSCFTDGSGRPGFILGNALDGRVDMPKLDVGNLIRNLFSNGNGRYLLARLDRPEGAVYASLAFSDDEAIGRYVIARVVETGEMQAVKLVVTEAGELGQTLAADGAVDVYGILFDYDKADVKAESVPQLDAIAALLKAQPALKLDVVGHTDSTGGADYNRDLSERRAAAVVAALAADYGIDASRLSAKGMGLSQPVASNDDETGRARNRRVELVRR